MASSGDFVQTGYIPIRKGGTFVGVLNTNYLASRLSSVINSNRILTSGYCYLIDSNSSALISHPKLSSACTTIQCAEGMSQSEYAAFAVAVLQPIRGNGYLLNDAASIVFKKQGANWRLTASSVVVGTVRYTVIATVPNSEVEKTSTDTTNSINATVVSMVIAFAFCIVGFLVILVGYAWYMIKLIVNPVNDLRAVFALVRNDDLTGVIPTKSSSLDMKILLEAFSKVPSAISLVFNVVNR